MVAKLAVLKKGGTSYLEIPGHYRESYLVNGLAPTACPGDSGWCMVDGDVESVKVVVPSSRILVGFKLKEEFRGIVNVPETLDKEAFTWDSEDYAWEGERVELYEPVHEDGPVTYQDVAFEVLDYDCEPVAMPKYVVVDFPANLKYPRQVQHKYPCHVPMPEVFKLVADAVVEETQKYPGLYELHDCRNIQVLGVKVIIAKKPVQVRKKDVFAKRPKWITVTETHVKRDVMKIVGDYKDGTGYEQIVGIQGDNFADLWEKLGAYIQSFVDRIDPRRWCVCEACSGTGVQEVK